MGFLEMIIGFSRFRTIRSWMLLCRRTLGVNSCESAQSSASGGTGQISRLDAFATTLDERWTGSTCSSPISCSAVEGDACSVRME